MGADFIARSGLGDELNYIAVDKHSPLLLSQEYPNIFSVGDSSDIPASRARFCPGALGPTVTEPKHRVPKKVDTAS